MLSTDGHFIRESPEICLDPSQTKFIESLTTIKSAPFPLFSITTDPKLVNILPEILISIEKNILILLMPLMNSSVSDILIEA